MTWFTETRIEWIIENTQIFGRMRREFICQKFGVSIPQASIDIREAIRRDSNIVYNKSTKQYEYDHGD